MSYQRESDVLRELDRRARRLGGALTELEVDWVRSLLVAQFHPPLDETDVGEIEELLSKRRGVSAKAETEVTQEAFQTRLQNEYVRALRESEELVHIPGVRSQIRRIRRFFGKDDPPFPNDPAAATRWQTSQLTDDPEPPVVGKEGLDLLDEATKKVSGLTGCMPEGPDGAVALILCGRTPYLPPVTIRPYARFGNTRPPSVSIEVNYPWVSAKTVRLAYLAGLKQLEQEGCSFPASPRMPSDATSALLDLVRDTPKLKWSERWQRWRGTYPAWTNRYSSPEAMKAAYSGARKRWPSMDASRRSQSNSSFTWTYSFELPEHAVEGSNYE